MTNRTILLWVLAAFLIFAFILMSPNPPAALIGSTRAALSLHILESDATVRSPSRAASLMPAEFGGLASVSTGILSMESSPSHTEGGIYTPPDEQPCQRQSIIGHLEKYSLEAGRSAIEVAAVSV